MIGRSSNFGIVLKDTIHPLATKEDRDAASEDWRKLESEQGDVWSYTISKDDVTLIVRAERYVAYGSHIPRFDDDGGRRTLAR